MLLSVGAPSRPSKHDRLKLVGQGDRLLGLVLKHTPASHQWAQWLRLPLASAAYDGDAASVEELLAAGADGKAGPRGSDGSTLLHLAARGGSERAVRALLKAGCMPDVNQPTLSDQNPLHIAAKLGHSGASSALVEAGAYVNCRDQNGWTPLHLAARFGQIEVVLDLLREGADHGAQDANGYRPLHYAAMWSHSVTLKALIAAGASLEPPTRVDGTRPLHIAARYASSNIVRDLLLMGAEKDAKTFRGFTPLHAAAASNKVGAVSLLLAAGAGVDIPSGLQRFTPLHLAARKGAVEACCTLLEAGASVLARTLDGSTPLHLACTLLKASAVRVLLLHGADEMTLNGAGRPPADVIAGLYSPSREAGTTTGGGNTVKSEIDDGEYGGVRGGQNNLLITEIQQRLAIAPADRAWARRGLLIMARRCWKGKRNSDTDSSRDHDRRGSIVEDALVTRKGYEDEATGGSGGAYGDQSSAEIVTSTAGEKKDDSDEGERVVVATNAAGYPSGGDGDGVGDHGCGSNSGGKQEPRAKRRRSMVQGYLQTVAYVSDSDDSTTAVSADESSLLAQVVGIDTDGVFQRILSFL